MLKWQVATRFSSAIVSFIGLLSLIPIARSDVNCGVTGTICSKSASLNCCNGLTCKNSVCSNWSSDSCKATGEKCDCKSCGTDCCSSTWGTTADGWCWCRPSGNATSNTCLSDGKPCSCGSCGSDCCSQVWMGHADWCQCASCLSYNTSCNCSWCWAHCCSQKWKNNGDWCSCQGKDSQH